MCTVDGAVLTMVAPGAYTVIAAQAGDDQVDPAQPISLTLKFSSSELHLVPTLTAWGVALIGLLAAMLGARQARRIQEA